MRKIGFYMLSLSVVMLLGMTSCSNKDQEKKIAELENKVRELQGSNGATATPATPATPAQPETKPEGPLPSFQFEQTEHDFGTITDGDIVSHTFEFTNTGEAPLIIQGARGSCGCTVPSWPKEPIGVGETAKITAEFNSKGKTGNQNKMITITANTWPKQTTLRIKAQVNPAQ